MASRLNLLGLRSRLVPRLRGATHVLHHGLLIVRRVDVEAMRTALREAFKKGYRAPTELLPSLSYPR